MPPEGLEDPATERDARAFHRNLLIVGSAHVAVLLLLFLFSKWQPRPTATQIMWLDGGAGGGAEETQPHEAQSAETESSAPDVQPPTPPVPDVPSPPEERPAPSELPLPRATPPITPLPATPKPATPKPATTPRASPPESPKPKPTKPARTSPSPSAARKSNATAKPKSPAVAAKSTPGSHDAERASANASPSPAKSGQHSSAAADAGSGAGAGKTGSGSGAGTNEFAWYYEMLDDRFTSRWEQPLSIVRSTQQFVTTLKIRINKDGAIVLREIANSSGNPVMDESVLAAARKVLVVDPLPAGLGGESFEVNINFKLDQGQ
jgi:TonB family protein